MLDRLLDSVILIDHFNGHPKASGFLAGLNPDSTAISVITLAEILVGLEKEDENERYHAEEHQPEIRFAQSSLLIEEEQDGRYYDY